MTGSIVAEKVNDFRGPSLFAEGKAPKIVPAEINKTISDGEGGAETN